MSGMKSAVDLVLKSLARKRSAISHCNELLNEGNDKCKELDLTELQLPCQRKPPKRISGPAVAFHHETTERYALVEYYKLIDTASSKLTETVNQVGAVDFQSLPSCLLSGDVNVNHACQYPEREGSRLCTQLDMFRQQFAYETIHEAADVIRSQVSEVRKLLSQVEISLRILLVIPVKSCEAERSYSCLRRLKTWLQSTISQDRTP
jgi:hypothetical protein